VFINKLHVLHIGITFMLITIVGQLEGTIDDDYIFHDILNQLCYRRFHLKIILISCVYSFE